MRGYDQTSMGGVGDVFLTTHRSHIEKTQALKEGKRALIVLLLDKHWKPVYCYLCRK